MKFERRVAVASLCAAMTAAAACSSGSTAAPGAGTSGGSSNASASGSVGSASGGSSSGAAGGTGASSGTAGGASSNSSVATTSSGSSGDPSAAGSIQCGASMCDAPNSCCQSADGTTSCVVSCTAQEKQLCTNDADCQASATATCVNGTCTDSSPTDGGTTDVYVPPLPDGSVVVPGDGGGAVPSNYPQPTAANRALCQTTTMLVNGLCPGGGAGPVCIECLFGGSTYNNAQTPAPEATAEAGNYVVTVQLGGSAAGQTSISAESSRGLLTSVTTAAGQSVTYAFAVNVRAMEGQPNHAGGPGGYPGLDLFFSGPTSSPPQIAAIGYALATAQTKPITVFMASDSTTCDQTGNVFGGWGQMLPEYFGPPVAIANYANSGASSGSFYGAFWPLIKAKWTAGDYVIVQFGHNDKGVSDATVQANLEMYISDALAANVTPIVVSPPARVQFAGSVEGDQSSLHAAAAKAAAAAKSVAYIDLTALSTAWYNSLGSQAAAMKFHANGTDATHTNLAGAEKLAGLVAGAMKTQKMALSKYLR